MAQIPNICITPGDPRGIGPEILEKSVPFLSELPARFWVFGATRHLRCAAQNIHLVDEPSVPPGLDPMDFLPSWAIEAATQYILGGAAEALVTGPISKAALNRAGYSFQGHTDFLAALSKARDVTMMLANPSLRVSLVTTHIPLRAVPDALNHDRLRRCTLHTLEALTEYWGIREPLIKILALNPHAGEGGLIGSEEESWLNQSIQNLAREFGARAKIIGPVPADTFFLGSRADAIVALYHDQGLIPVKLLDFQKTINVTLGLPFIRTSVDHGTAFDIAGKGIADPSSFQFAVKQALDWILRRHSR